MSLPKFDAAVKDAFNNFRDDFEKIVEAFHVALQSAKSDLLGDPADVAYEDGPRPRH